MSTSDARPRGTGVLVVLVLAGAALALALGVYGRVHEATGEAIFTFGFPTMLDMKAWLATVGLALGVAQVSTALRIYGRFGRGPSPRVVSVTHRVSGTAAVLVTLPVAFHCLWSLGLASDSPRVLIHSVLGCIFYGAFLTKMLALRSARVPGWALPVLGGVVFSTLVVVWLTSAGWFWANGSPSY